MSQNSITSDIHVPLKLFQHAGKVYTCCKIGTFKVY